MPSSSSSKTGSRRNNGRGSLAPILALVLLCAAARGGAQSLNLGVTVRSDGIFASLSFLWNKETELVSSLRDGLESRIVFTLRVYQKRGGVLPFPGDKLLTETVLARSAFWDFLDGKFVVESDDGVRTAYASADDLLSGFFSLKDLPVYRGPTDSGRLRYVTARARLEPVRLMPPLTIVSIAGTAASYTTPWQRRDAK